VAETAAQSKESFFFCFSSKDSDFDGRSAWSPECHINGIDSSIASLVGSTACHGLKFADLSMASSAARSPLTLIVPRNFEILLGTVWAVRRTEIGALNNVSSA